MKQECKCELTENEWVLCSAHHSPTVLYLLNSYQSRVLALEAREKELEVELASARLGSEKGLLLSVHSLQKENARLRKVVDACRKNTHRSPEIAEALRELDGENEHNDHVDGSEYGSNPHWSEDDPSRE